MRNRGRFYPDTAYRLPPERPFYVLERGYDGIIELVCLAYHIPLTLLILPPPLNYTSLNLII